MDTKTLLTIAVLFLITSFVIRTTSPPGNRIDPESVSVPAFADNYVIKTTVVNGETATVYYTSYSPTKGTFMTITVYPRAAVTTKTVYWYSNGTWYYVTGGILESTTSYSAAGTITLNMRLDNNVLVLYSGGRKYTPFGTFKSIISAFTITTSNTTIEYTIYSARYVPLKP